MAFRLKLRKNNGAMLKQILLIILLLFALPNVHAQENSIMKLGIEPGFLLFSDSDNLGIFINVEPKLKFSEKALIGMRFGFALNAQKFENKDVYQFYIGTENDHAIVSFVPTFDYYLNENKFQPYVGLGIGIYLMSKIDVSRISVFPAEEVIEVGVNNQVGLLLRGGFESGKLRLGLEYNLIRKADIKMPNGQVIGTVDNSYLGLSIGLIIGNGYSAE
jgi:hypothetical protein